MVYGPPSIAISVLVWIDASLVKQLTEMQSVDFHVSHIREIKWKHTFDSLVLPEGYKNLLLAFAWAQSKEAAKPGDMGEGKGIF